MSRSRRPLNSKKVSVCGLRRRTSAGSSRRASGWSRNVWSASASLAREESRVERVGRAAFVEDDQVELELVVDAGEDAHLVVELDERAEPASFEHQPPQSGRALGLMQPARHHHADGLPLANELPGPFEEELEQVGVAPGRLPLDRDLAVVALDFLLDLGGLVGIDAAFEQHVGQALLGSPRSAPTRPGPRAARGAAARCGGSSRSPGAGGSAGRTGDRSHHARA